MGRIVAAAASVHLTPCTLELGGKCPLYMDENINMEVAVKRLLWGKCMGQGQTCVAPDYVLCNQKTEQKLLATINKTIHSFYGQNQIESPDTGR